MRISEVLDTPKANEQFQGALQWDLSMFDNTEVAAPGLLEMRIEHDPLAA
jgi:hypothetical protein